MQRVLLFQFLVILVGVIGSLMLAKIGIEFWATPLPFSLIGAAIMGITAANIR